MPKRMLIDSTHAEETRVVVLDGNRLEDYDVETSTKRQLKGNIYLAKIVRVEPSLQAAFVEFGGGRHGFLAFGEIHPDYYQIPVADRKRLLELQEQEAREQEEEEDRAAAREEAGEDEPDTPAQALPETIEPAAADDTTEAAYAIQADPEAAAALEAEVTGVPAEPDPAEPDPAEPDAAEPTPMPRPDQVAQPASVAHDILIAPGEAHALFPSEPEDLGSDIAPEAAEPALPGEESPDGGAPAGEDAPLADMFGDPGPAEMAATRVQDAPARPSPTPEAIGDDAEPDDRADRRSTPRFLRNYKIQEVIRRRQIMLVQVVKEERGTKGAALTTYISLAGRFSVLMPNSPRGGGISRKITSAADRRRLKEVMAELDLPRGMGLIVRTAGANRPKAEILRDGEYLLNQWDQIRDLTMRSMAPALIYEEASLIKRAIRDVYSRDVDEIVVDGEQGWRAARDFMRMLMPTHAKKVQLWREPQPLFAKAQVEAQLDGMLQPTVQLRSGGYLVINQTEALVAIDVNSGRSTRERGIEETALRTNLEAAEEAARQLRLRDLAGLIVIDFIDMESRRNNTSVEKRLKDALRQDRARIQVGSISHFGLLEMSRQRLRPSLTETSFVTCPHCGGTGHVRSTESAALAVLRGIEEEGGKRRSAEIVVHVSAATALYMLNHKRARLAEIEGRHAMHISFAATEQLPAGELYRIERVRAQTASDLPPPVSQLAPPEPEMEPVEDEAEDVADEAEPAAAESEAAETGTETGEEKQRRRRRRRRGGRREDGAATPSPGEDEAEADTPEGTDAAEPAEAAAGDAEAPAEATAENPDETQAGAPDDAQGEAERKRRGRRGGRRRRRSDAPGSETEAPAGDVVPVPAYVGPTPADPFVVNDFAFFDAVEQAEDLPAPAAPQPVAAEPPPAAPELPAVPELPAPPELQAAAESPPPLSSAPNYDPDIAGPIPGTPMPGNWDPSIAGPAVPEAKPEAPPEPAAPPVELDGAELAAPEPPLSPAIQPVLIGEADPASEKKRGWWRR